MGVSARIEPKDIKLGMRFSEPVFFDDGKNMFLAKGQAVKKYHLAALSQWPIPFLITSGNEIKDES